VGLDGYTGNLVGIGKQAGAGDADRTGAVERLVETAVGVEAGDENGVGMDTAAEGDEDGLAVGLNGPVGDVGGGGGEHDEAAGAESRVGLAVDRVVHDAELHGLLAVGRDEDDGGELPTRLRKDLVDVERVPAGLLGCLAAGPEGGIDLAGAGES